MKWIKKTIFIIVLIIFTLASLSVLVYFGHLNKPISVIAESFLNNKLHTKVHIDNLQINKNNISINKINITIDNDFEYQIESFNANLSFAELINKRSITSDINAKINLYNQDQIILTSDVTANCAMNIINASKRIHANFNEIDSALLSNTLGTSSSKGKLLLDYNNTAYPYNQTLNLDLSFNDDTYLKFNSHSSSNNNFKVNGSVSNVPIATYKIAETFIKNNKVLEFISTYIKAGKIANGQFQLDLDKEFFKTGILSKKNLTGNLKAQEIEFLYNKDFVPLTQIDLDIVLAGLLTTAKIEKCYNGDTLISDGSIVMDWKGVDDTKVEIRANASGPAKDLINFIRAKSLDKLETRNIYLRRTKGEAKSKINIDIPIAENKLVRYDIDTIINNVAISMFKDQVMFRKGKITGNLNNERLNLKAVGEINEFSSDGNYFYNFHESGNDIEQSLNISTKLIGSKDLNLPLVKISKGNAIIKFDYQTTKKNNQKDQIHINSDISQLEFIIDKLGIHKPLNQKANLAIDISMMDDMKDLITFNLKGANSLNIHANATLFNDNKVKINLPQISYLNTDIKANLEIEPKMMKVIINGKALDLSSTNMAAFLVKDTDNVGFNAKINLENLKLKNNVIMNDIDINIICSTQNCSHGHVYSKINKDKGFFKASLLRTKDKSEKWTIQTNNAGALFSGIGIFNSMKNGNMDINVITKRSTTGLGKIIPITNGEFIIKKFILMHNPITTQIISLASFSGLLKALGNNSDMTFYSIKGDFEYLNEILTIKNTNANGMSFDFTMLGIVNTQNHTIKLKGVVVPSLYGINTVLSYIPIFGQIFSSKNRDGVIAIPYNISQSY
ncbi:MAG: DUF3971 domain-containing protein [Rickettsiaceae bacterium]